jgi:hypothetical protein
MSHTQLRTAARVMNMELQIAVNDLLICVQTFLFRNPPPLDSVVTNDVGACVKHLCDLSPAYRASFANVSWTGTQFERALTRKDLQVIRAVCQAPIQRPGSAALYSCGGTWGAGSTTPVHSSLQVPRATGHDSHATGHDQRATGHHQRATGHDQRATGHDQRATGHDQRATGRRGWLTPK